MSFRKRSLNGHERALDFLHTISCADVIWNKTKYFLETSSGLKYKARVEIFDPMDVEDIYLEAFSRSQTTKHVHRTDCALSNEYTYGNPSIHFRNASLFVCVYVRA